MKNARLWLLLGFGFTVLAAGFWLWRAQPLLLDTVHPRFGSAVELVYATGYVGARYPVSVAARVTAPVERVLVDESDHVRRGQVLLTLNDDEQRGELAQAMAEARRTALDEQRSLALFRQGWRTRAARDHVVGEAATARAAEASAIARGWTSSWCVPELMASCSSAMSIPVTSPSHREPYCCSAIQSAFA